MAVGNSVQDVWLGKFNYTITPELESQYYKNNRIEFDLNLNEVYISSKDFECFIHDVNTYFKHIHNLPRSEQLAMGYRFTVFRNNEIILETYYIQDPTNANNVNLVYRQYDREDLPYRMKENLLRVVYRVPNFNLEM